MQKFKSEFHAGTGKNIIVFHVYVPSQKRKNAMSKEQKAAAKNWASETLKHAKEMLQGIIK